MSLKKAGTRSQRYKQQWAVSALATLIIATLLVLFLIPLPGNTEGDKTNSNRLPAAPSNGSPEEDFTAGGTRNNSSRDTVCGVDDQQTNYSLPF